MKKIISLALALSFVAVFAGETRAQENQNTESTTGENNGGCEWTQTGTWREDFPVYNNFLKANPSDGEVFKGFRSYDYSGTCYLGHVGSDYYNYNGNDYGVCCLNRRCDGYYVLCEPKCDGTEGTPQKKACYGYEYNSEAEKSECKSDIYEQVCQDGEYVWPDNTPSANDCEDVITDSTSSISEGVDFKNVKEAEEFYLKKAIEENILTEEEFEEIKNKQKIDSMTNTRMECKDQLLKEDNQRYATMFDINKKEDFKTTFPTSYEMYKDKEDQAFIDPNHPAVKPLVDKATQYAKSGMSLWEFMERAFKDVKNSMTYDPCQKNSLTNFFSSPGGGKDSTWTNNSLERGIGVCRNQGDAFQLMMSIFTAQNENVTSGSKSIDGHLYNWVESNGERFYVDVTREPTMIPLILTGADNYEKNHQCSKKKDKERINGVKKEYQRAIKELQAELKTATKKERPKIKAELRQLRSELKDFIKENSGK